jgi:hypothetical protein
MYICERRRPSLQLSTAFLVLVAKPDGRGCLALSPCSYNVHNQPVYVEQIQIQMHALHTYETCRKKINVLNIKAVGTLHIFATYDIQSCKIF